MVGAGAARLIEPGCIDTRRRRAALMAALGLDRNDEPRAPLGARCIRCTGHRVHPISRRTSVAQQRRRAAAPCNPSPASIIAQPSGSGTTAVRVTGQVALANTKSVRLPAWNQSPTAASTYSVLYWQIGRDILERQAQQGWGSKVIERLARDLREAFPEVKGFSRANLMDMRAFAEAWGEAEIVQQTVGQLPWGHNLLLTRGNLAMCAHYLPAA